jgi:hypothetical protein
MADLPSVVVELSSPAAQVSREESVNESLALIAGERRRAEKVGRHGSMHRVPANATEGISRPLGSFKKRADPGTTALGADTLVGVMNDLNSKLKIEP